MSDIYSAFTSLWDPLREYMSDSIVDCLISISLIFLIYVLFIRSLLMLFRADALKRLTDIVFLIVMLCTILQYIPFTFNFNNNLSISEDLVEYLSGGAS